EEGSRAYAAVEHETEVRGVKAEPRPADARSARRSSAETGDSERDDRSSSSNSIDGRGRMGPLGEGVHEEVQRHQRRDGVDSDENRRQREGRNLGRDQQASRLAVTMESVTLGGRRAPPPPRGPHGGRGVHVRLPLQGRPAHPAHHGALLPPRGAMPQDHNPHWRQQQQQFPPGRGPPPPRANIGAVPQGRYAHGSTSPPPRWPINQHAGARPFHGGGVGNASEGGGFHHHHHRQQPPPRHQQQQQQQARLP
ncbi:unnamed protein product, partial [Ectocarpus sp. 12 AP-2014]